MSRATFRAAPRAALRLFVLVATAGGFCAAPALAAPPVRECPPYKELRPPRVVRDQTVWWLSRAVDPEWFACNRKKGGVLTGRSMVERNGVWELDSGNDSAGASPKLGAWASNYCGRSGKADPQRVRFELIGRGPLSPASYTSEALPSLCGCAGYRQVELKAAATAEGMIVKGGLNPVWLACARDGGGQLELRVYSGATEAQALAAVTPAAVLRGLEHKATFATTFSNKQLCKAGAKIAVVELAGRGPLAQATGDGREQVQLQCR